ncbi:type II secretion system protein N [Brevundimonas sp. NPDC092305]|uniref:type II secretion system protein N n=1 Tax=Brevundimonas sp. NPDC092305 TaxID=3363957 RepID=UPI00381D0C7B
MNGLLRSPTFWFRLVSLVVVVSVALGVARLTWRLVGWDDGRETVWTPAALAPMGGQGGGELASILGWAPFGGGGGSDGLPISNLGLVLKGVVYAPAGGSTALISAGEGPVQIFSVGDTPIGSAIIEAIESDRVILNTGGRREALLLPQAAGAPGSTSAATPVVSGPAATPAAAPDAQPAPTASSPVGSSPTTATRTPGSATSPAAAMTTMGVASSPQGYVVSADSPPQILRAGLKAGDVIRSLNGQTLGDPTRDRQVFESAAGAGRARVEILRDGRSMTLTVPLR